MNTFTSKEIKAIEAAIQTKELAASHKQVLSNLIKTSTENEKNASLFVDGAADLNSKTAGIGGALFMNGQEIYSFAEPLLDKTNNEAEYMAMIQGIQGSLELNIRNLNIYSDSELVVKQINGEYKIKNDRMKRLHSQVVEKLTAMDFWTVSHVRREKNTRADTLSKMGMEKARESK